jgi:hypothetical protein
MNDNIPLRSIAIDFRIHDIYIDNNKFEKRGIYDFRKYEKSYDILRNLTLFESSIIFNRYDFLTRKYYGKSKVFEKLYLNLKKQFIYKHIPIHFFVPFILFERIQKCNNILCVSSNYKIIEPIFYYIDNPLVTHLFFTKKSKNEEKKKLIIETYQFNNYELSVEPKEEYDFMFMDLIYKSKIDLKKDHDEYMKEVQNNERDNIFLLERCYNLLVHLRKEGILILYVYAITTDETLLLLQNIGRCFKNVYLMDKYMVTSIINDHKLFVFEGFIGIEDTINYFSEKFINSIRKYHDQFLTVNNLYAERAIYIKEHINEDTLIKSIIEQNKVYSYDLARILKFDVYEIKDDIDKVLLKSLEKIFSFDLGMYLITRKHSIPQVKLKIDKYKIPKEIKYYSKLSKSSTRQIDFRDHKVYDEVKKYIRAYEKTLNKDLMKYGISANRRPVSRAWIKMYEMLFMTKIIDNKKGTVDIFHICEAPGNWIVSIEYYISKWNRKLKYVWDAETLHPSVLGKEVLGDDYGLIKKFKERWTYGADGTGDITKRKNIKYYHDICKRKDWIMGDCGMPFDKDQKPNVILFYSQMLFMLYNMKNGAGCIFKQLIFFDQKILVDMMYLLFISCKKVEIYKSVQNKFSPEFYVICSEYNKILTDEDFDKLFSILEDERIMELSVIEEYNRDFLFQFCNVLEKLTASFNLAIDRQLYYTDFWKYISEFDKNEIKRYINIKNKDWIEYYIFQK